MQASYARTSRPAGRLQPARTTAIADAISSCFSGIARSWIIVPTLLGEFMSPDPVNAPVGKAIPINCGGNEENIDLGQKRCASRRGIVIRLNERARSVLQKWWIMLILSAPTPLSGSAV
jgi:hypothetical protein